MPAQGAVRDRAAGLHKTGRGPRRCADLRGRYARAAHAPRQHGDDPEGALLLQRQSAQDDPQSAAAPAVQHGGTVPRKSCDRRLRFGALSPAGGQDHSAEQRSA